MSLPLLPFGNPPHFASLLTTLLFVTFKNLSLAFAPKDENPKRLGKGINDKTFLLFSTILNLLATILSSFMYNMPFSFFKLVTAIEVMRLVTKLAA